jgi:hypothetical protein
VPVDCVHHVIRIGQIHIKFTWTIHVPDTKFGFDLEVYNTSPARQISDWVTITADFNIGLHLSSDCFSFYPARRDERVNLPVTSERSLNLSATNFKDPNKNTFMVLDSSECNTITVGVGLVLTCVSHRATVSHYGMVFARLFAQKFREIQA